MILERVKTM